MLVELLVAKNMFEMGSLKKCTIEYFSIFGGWQVSFGGAKGTDVVILESQRDSGGHGRIFKTLDTAFACAHKIGFRDVSVRNLG